MAPSRYVFRTMSAADLPRVRRWLAMPHVAEWWGDPDQQYILVGTDLDEPAMEQFIVSIDERPFAYLQCYDPRTWPEGNLGFHPDGTRGIDQFIGDPDLVGRGHGHRMIRNFVDRLFGGGTPRGVTDPAAHNQRAIRAYEKAGFRKSPRSIPPTALPSS